MHWYWPAIIAEQEAAFGRDQQILNAEQPGGASEVAGKC